MHSLTSHLRIMDMTVPGNMHPDQDDDAWAQGVVTVLTATAADDGAHGSLSGDDMVMLNSPLSIHPTSPLPSAISSPVAKKLVKLAVPTYTSTCHKLLLISKTAKKAPAVKPKTALALLKGKASTLPVPPAAGSGPSVPLTNALTVCGSVVEMTTAGASEGVGETITDSSVATRDNALVSQLSDVHKYISNVRSAQLPVQNASMAEDLHTLGESIVSFIDATEGHFSSFQAVLNTITERITTSAAPEPVCAPPVPMYFPAAPPKCSVPTAATAAIMAAPIPVIYMPSLPSPRSTPLPKLKLLTLQRRSYSTLQPWDQSVASKTTIFCVLVEEACSIVFCDDPSGLNFHDVPDIRHINPTSLIITFKFPKDATDFLSAFSLPSHSEHFQHLKAEFVGDLHHPNDRPTMDDICGPPVSVLSSVPPPSGYDNYAHS
ncbi:uncharacterized protein ARMOST_11701 [Armillaria ostoyae]|uniref:Uncharacterized protein n=1 Tax=Armillaria ostoyae TaxID=47428 RepID=A0A284RHU9_ARMOS|nr:uncharacterized protein ARMOST_11701 [Armillaria ostoyae]